MELEKLLSLPESKTLEFKRDLSSLPSVLKTIVAFANTAGGILIVGKDANGTLVGLADVLSAEEKLANAISENIRPSLLPEIGIATMERNNLLIVKVSHWRGPFYIKREGTPRGIYVRLGSTSRPVWPELLDEIQRTLENVSFDQAPLTGLKPECLDQNQIDVAFENVGKRVNQEKLRSLGILVPSATQFVPSIGGLIIFGKHSEREQYVPNARVSCARFQGTTKSHILDRHDVEGTILAAVDIVPKFIARNTRLAAEITTMRRKDIAEYPEVAVREALINALVHADYSIKGSHLQIAIYSDRLEIQNPGMLLLGFTLEDLKSGVSRVRNRTIARVFRELQLVEEWGSGYRRMIDYCHAHGYPEPEWEELGSTIRITFYPHPATQIQPQVAMEANKLSPREQVILDLLTSHEVLAVREIAKHLNYIVSERALRYDLSWLHKMGLVVAEGKGAARMWRKTD